MTKQFDNSALYKSELKPLVKQLFSLCKANGMAMYFVVHVASDGKEDSIYETRVVETGRELPELFHRIAMGVGGTPGYFTEMLESLLADMAADDLKPTSIQ